MPKWLLDRNSYWYHFGSVCCRRSVEEISRCRLNLEASTTKRAAGRTSSPSRHDSLSCTVPAHSAMPPVQEAIGAE